MDSTYYLLALLALVLLSASPSLLVSRLASLPTWPYSAWRILVSTFGATRAKGAKARLGRLEREIASIKKIAQMQLSRATNDRRVKAQPVRHGKMARDKCRKRDLVYRLAIGSARINHSEYKSELVFNLIRGLTLETRKKALIQAAEYASTIGEDMSVRVIEFKDGKQRFVAEVKGRRSKIKGSPTIGFAKICWLGDQHQPVAEAA